MKEKTNVEKNKKATSWAPARVFRGGYCYGGLDVLRSAKRPYDEVPYYRGNYIGFRLVLQTKEKK